MNISSNAFNSAALTSPTGGGRSVGIVRSRTKATEFSLVFRSSFVGMLVHILVMSKEASLRLWSHGMSVRSLMSLEVFLTLRSVCWKYQPKLTQCNFSLCTLHCAVVEHVTF
jgi:hypothetical protein